MNEGLWVEKLAKATTNRGKSLVLFGERKTQSRVRRERWRTNMQRETWERMKKTDINRKKD